MAISKVKDYFKKYGLDGKILEFKDSSATVELAAKALNCLPGMIAKSLTFSVNGQSIMIVTAGDVKIDNSKYKHFFGAKAKMLSYSDVKECIGHEVGGVCPFAINDDVLVYLDVSLRKYEFVYPACGSDNSAIKLSISQLEQFSNYIEWIDVCGDNI